MLAASLACPLAAQVSSRNDTVGRLLNEWYSDGTAAGLAAITYENRDGQHSPLDPGLYPQLQVFQHNPGTGPDKGPAMQIRLGPTLGNCSMSALARLGGSLPRFYLVNPKGGAFLMAQYLANNLFIYPEHEDHDVGANGVGGYGDLFPANSPCCLISQGSSGSDQPFLRAVLAVIAAFPRETQRVLIQKRVLMPTVQAILRQTSRGVTRPEQYFTAAAHPVVFDASMIDEEKMVRMARAMTPDLIPPLVQMEVVQETEPGAGSQFFEAPGMPSHKLADARVFISRVFRGSLDRHGMVLNLGQSSDLMGRPLQVRMEVLQGEPGLVQIDRTGQGPYARLRLRWHAPMTGPSGIRSHRVDVGVFVANGVTVSAPGIISFYMLPNERRFYNGQGRLSEIAYLAANPDIGLPADNRDPRWIRVLLAASIAGDGLRSRLMEKLLSEAQRKVLQAFWQPLDRQRQELANLESQAQAAPEKKNGAEKLRNKLGDDIAEALRKPLQEPGGKTVRQVLEDLFDKLAQFSELYLDLRPEIDRLAEASPKVSAREDIQREVRRLVDLGVLIEQAGGTLVATSPQESLTEADRHYLRELNLMVLSQALFPEVLERSTAPAFVDSRLTSPKPWRDVFRYDEAGVLLGWVRHQESRTHFFDASGRLLPEGLRHPEKGREVSYDRDAAGLLRWK
jgi:hypothetical protein